MIDVCRMLWNFKTLISKYIKIRYEKFFNENMNNIKSAQFGNSQPQVIIYSESVSFQKKIEKKKNI